MALLVGIAGGSGSGKTTLALAVARALPAGQAQVVPADAYYRDLAHLPPAARAQINFDEPAALDGERLLADLRELRAGRSAARPVYDFATHTRSPERVVIPPCAVVVVEGILVLAIPELRELLDLKVFVAAARSARLERRIARDVGERGRTRDSVLAQFARHTEPMHARFVEPSRAHADLVVSGEDPVAEQSARVIAGLPPPDCMVFRQSRD
jgi:uridine kinase